MKYLATLALLLACTIARADETIHTYSGLVTDDHNDAIPNASIYLAVDYQDANSSPHRTYVLGNADAEGHYSINVTVPAGSLMEVVKCSIVSVHWTTVTSGEAEDPQTSGDMTTTIGHWLG